MLTLAALSTPLVVVAWIALVAAVVFAFVYAKNSRKKRMNPGASQYSPREGRSRSSLSDAMSGRDAAIPLPYVRKSERRTAGS